MERPAELASVDYGFICDLAAANGWKVGLALIESDRRFQLRISDGDRLLASVKFSTAEGSIDTAADVALDVLREAGAV